MVIKQSRRLNRIKESGNTVQKLVLESEAALVNEIYALNLLKMHSPKLIAIEGKELTLEKIKGVHLSDLTIDEDVLLWIATGLNYIHSHKKDRKSFIHGDLHKDNILISNSVAIFLDFSCSEYSDPLEDAAAVEIHITDDPGLLKTFYSVFNTKRDRQKIDRYKISHCLRHLEWAEKEGFCHLAEKSRRIIKEIKDGKAKL